MTGFATGVAVAWEGTKLAFSFRALGTFARGGHGLAFTFAFTSEVAL